MREAENFDVVIIGAGAAGLFCASVAGKRGKRVLLLEHNDAPGAKILISGGGRCNFTNRNVAAENFISGNTHFCRSALAGYSADDFIAHVEAHGIAYHEKKLGQLFCDGSAREIVAMLVEDCQAAGVEIRCSQKITAVSKSDIFHVESSGKVITTDALVLATGGLSIPKMGATGFAHDLAKQFGLALTDIKPGLVPLVFAGEQWAWMQGLSGVSFDAIATTGRNTFQEAALFTHRGLSGPAILQISSYWQDGHNITLDMLPGQDAYAFLLERKASRPKAELKTILGEILPARLAHNILQPPLGNHVIGTMPNIALQKTAATINHFTAAPSGSEGYAKAEVTIGGINTNELSSKTMEARKIPGLFIIGEAVDVTGWLGGYNFQWAWSSAWCAGNAV